MTLEWLINPSGTLRASFFYRENTDYLAVSTDGSGKSAKRYGGSLTYKKEFQNFGQLFDGIFRRKPKPIKDTSTAVPMALPPVANKSEEETPGENKNQEEKNPGDKKEEEEEQ